MSLSVFGYSTNALQEPYIHVELCSRVDTPSMRYPIPVWCSAVRQIGGPLCGALMGHCDLQPVLTCSKASFQTQGCNLIHGGGWVGKIVMYLPTKTSFTFICII